MHTTRQTRWATVAVATLALLGACGGSSSDDPETSPSPTVTTTKAAPATSYSLAQLEAALPRADDIAGATESRICPKDKGDCLEYQSGMVVTEASVEPASRVGSEQVVDQATPKDFVAVQAQRHPDPAAATTLLDQSAAFDAKYVGAYDIKLDDNGRRSRGRGETGDVEIDGWTGIDARRTEVSSDSKTDEGLLIARVVLINGRTSVSTFVSLSAAGRDPDAAADLADGLARDYLERLGR